MIQKDDAGDSISACDDDDDSLFLIYVCSHQTGECTSSAQTNGLNSSHQLHRNKSSSSYMLKIRMTRLLLNHMANVRWRAFKGWQSLLYVPRKIKHAKKTVLNIFMMIMKIYQHAQWHIYSHYSSIGIIKERARVCSISSHTYMR